MLRRRNAGRALSRQNCLKQFLTPSHRKTSRKYFCGFVLGCDCCLGCNARPTSPWMCVSVPCTSVWNLVRSVFPTRGCRLLAHTQTNRIELASKVSSIWINRNYRHTTLVSTRVDSCLSKCLWRNLSNWIRRTGSLRAKTTKVQDSGRCTNCYSIKSRLETNHSLLARGLGHRVQCGSTRRRSERRFQDVLA